MASLAAKESIAGTIVTYIGVGIGFLTTFFILAKFLTPEEIGLTRLLPELATQLAGLGILGMTDSTGRFLLWCHPIDPIYDGMDDFRALHLPAPTCRCT